MNKCGLEAANSVRCDDCESRGLNRGFGPPHAAFAPAVTPSRRVSVGSNIFLLWLNTAMCTLIICAQFRLELQQEELSLAFMHLTQ